MRRKFLCDGCRMNCGTNEEGTINCELGEGPVKPVPFVRGMLYEQCSLRSVATGPTVEDLQALHRQALAGVPVYDPPGYMG